METRGLFVDETLAQTIPQREDLVEHLIARRLAAWRVESGWSLDALAPRAGMSSATLSRLERCDLSPTATMLGTLCGQYGWTLSRLMAEAQRMPSVMPAKERRSSQRIVKRDM